MVYIPGGSEPRREPLGQLAFTAPPYFDPHKNLGPTFGDPYAPEPYPPKRRRTGLIIGLVIAGLVAIGGVSVIAAAISSGGKPASTPTTAAGHPVAATGVPVKCADGVFSNTGLPNYCSDHGGVAPAVPVKPDPKGFTIGIKVLSKHCFGSAGCNVTFRIDPSYNGADFTQTKTWEIVYQVNGAKDAYTNRFELTGSRASFENEEMVSTASSSVSLTAVVTDVLEG